jgi:hypothetical protein
VEYTDCLNVFCTHAAPTNLSDWSALCIFE